jgi:hypothetical protein
MTFLFTNLSSYIHHIPIISCGIYILQSSDRYEYFTCGNHNIIRQIKNTKLYKNCKLCIYKVMNNMNIINSMLYTDLSIFIQHIPKYESGIYLLGGSHKKEYFTCGNHVNKQIIKNKTINLNKCVKCIGRNVIEDNILISILFINLSLFISHIPKISSGIFIPLSNNKKEYFTSENNLNLRQIKI